MEQQVKASATKAWQPRFNLQDPQDKKIEKQLQ